MKSVIKTVLLSYTTLIISVISSCQQEEEEAMPPTVTDLVVDLRYNPGGETDVARYLASALAPASVVSSEEVLVRYHYNDLLESYLLAREGEDSESLLSRFIPNGHNLNLNQVYFLTSQGTASASELLISGLDLG
ncbi:MAG: S41 family peptidase [Bacteroidota bacterium]